MKLYELLRQTADNLALLKRFGWHEYSGLYDCCKDAEDYIRAEMCRLDADTLNKEIDMTGESNEGGEQNEHSTWGAV